MSTMHVPVSAGELLDKITILRIKARRILEPAKQVNVQRELELLEKVWRESVTLSLSREVAELTLVNETLWDVEDVIRELESRADFGPRFIALARKVYLTNDRRAEIKKRVNVLLNSALVEEKSYAPYSKVVETWLHQGDAAPAPRRRASAAWPPPSLT